MLFLKEKKIIYKKFLYFAELQIIFFNKIYYFLLKNKYYGFLCFNMNYFNIFKFDFNVIYYCLSLNHGWVESLFLNGVGFRATKKYYENGTKFWRFNIGHSHVFKYFSPKNILFKSKNRYVCLYSVSKSQLFDVTNQIRIFRIPDNYKGVGIQFPEEFIKLKAGKLRQK